MEKINAKRIIYTNEELKTAIQTFIDKGITKAPVSFWISRLENDEVMKWFVIKTARTLRGE